MLLEHHFRGGGSRGGVVESVELGIAVEVVRSKLTRGEIFTASIGSVGLLYPSVFILCIKLHQFLILSIT